MPSRAFAARVQAERLRVLRMLRGLLASAQDAEDVYQDAVLHAWINLPTLRSRPCSVRG